MKVGVLGLQGDVREHCALLERIGATPMIVKHDDELDSVDALILPGGESTTIGKLLERYGLLEPLEERTARGLPVYGTCAGAILMAKEVGGAHDVPHRLKLMDLVVERNAYGRQVDSFEADLRVTGWDESFRAVFIRAPVIRSAGEGVEVLAVCDDRPVLVRQGRALASTFHPEIAGDPRVHELFLEMVG